MLSALINQLDRCDLFTTSGVTLFASFLQQDSVTVSWNDGHTLKLGSLSTSTEETTERTQSGCFKHYCVYPNVFYVCLFQVTQRLIINCSNN